MPSNLDQVERDLRAVLLTLRLMRVNPGLPPQLIPTIDTGIAAAERAVVQWEAIKSDILTTT